MMLLSQYEPDRGSHLPKALRITGWPCSESAGCLRGFYFKIYAPLLTGNPTDCIAHATQRLLRVTLHFPPQHGGGHPLPLGPRPSLCTGRNSQSSWGLSKEIISCREHSSPNSRCLDFAGDSEVRHRALSFCRYLKVLNQTIMGSMEPHAWLLAAVVSLRPGCECVCPSELVALDESGEFPKALPSVPGRCCGRAASLQPTVAGPRGGVIVRPRPCGSPGPDGASCSARRPGSQSRGQPAAPCRVSSASRFRSHESLDF